jgi:hypothetical protein
MRTFFKLFSFVFAAVFLLNGCKNPAENLNVLFDADVIKYKATFILSNADGTALPTNIAVSVNGPDAASIYDFSGSKTIFSPAGVITIGVAPSGVPTSGKPVVFNLIIKSAGYQDKNIPVSITADQFSQIVKVTMLKTVTTTPSTTVAVAEAPLAADGKTTTVTNITTPTSSTVSETTSISIPAGTQFKSADGTILTGGSVTAQAINFDASDPATLAMFPGGKLSAPNVVGPSGTGSAFFIPAGFTDIQMFVGGVEVKNFTTPINVGIQLDPTFKPLSSGAAVKEGDKLSVYSYQSSTGQFKFEKEGTVTKDAAGKVSVSFTTDHLTIFIVGDVVATASCKDPKVTYVAPWLNTGTAPLTVQILSNDESKVIASSLVVVSNGKVDSFKGLPAIPVKYRVLDAAGKVLSSGSIAAPCAGADITITIGAPDGPAIQNITLVLNVNCPGKGPITVPNFDLFYRLAGTGTYQPLGTAQSGLIKTALLKVGTAYDFRATWKNEIKVVNNRLITDLDMSTTVGDGANLGGKDPVGNRALLIEACKGF